MKKNYRQSILLILVASAIFYGCKKEENKPEEKEYVATDESFVNFASWPLQATKKGPNPSLGAAHAGNDTSVTRKVYFKDGQNPVNGKYPIGSLIVKHASNPAITINEFTAMVKRGKNFNPGAGDWEFFMLSPDGKIAKDAQGKPMRGANLMDGMCANCHKAAASKDFVFSK